MNTRDLPGSLDFVQCVDGKDTIIQDYAQVDGWQNAEVMDIIAQLEQSITTREIPPVPAVNFHITDDNIGEGGPKQKFARNIAAIETLFKLESENRNATTEEQEILSNYVGWGGLADAFDPDKGNWAKEYQTLKNLLSEDEYAAARASTLNAHYTSPTVIRSIYDAVGQMGFETGNILEPAMGIGNFFGMDTTENVIYLAGGCFWGMEQLMQSIPGVIDAQSGYANGTCEADATYQTVCKGDTGFRETVRVEYDPEQASLDALLLAYFYVIDPTVQNRQGSDRGSQYQTGVYYTNDKARETVERIADIERGRSEKFFVEIGPLRNYYPAEEYHQNYLEKNPNGYCHIPRAEMELFSRLRIDPGDYRKPAAETIRDTLTAEQYRVTQESGTERAFTGELWDKFEKGIYVDIVTGEPLFSSTDKYESGCGWPAFTKPIESPAVVEREDLSHGMRRTEVRSRAGDSHLGHVFTGDPESPNGVRYCINSAALRFVPYARMESEGYGYLLNLFEG